VEVKNNMRQKIKTIGYVSPVVFFLGLGLFYINGLWDIYSIGLTTLGIAAALLYLVVCFDDIREVFSARSFRSGANTLLVICLVLSLLVIVNMLGFRHFIWEDITIAKKYELSPLTMVILKEIEQKKQDVYIISFFWTYIDRSLSQEQNRTLILQNRERERKLRDLLRVYGGVSPYIQYRFLDPNRELMLARQYNIQRYRGNVAIIESGDNQEMVADMETEEQMTNALIKVLSDEKKVVYFLEGHQERDIDDGSPNGYMMAASAIRDQAYEIQRLNVVEAGGVPENARALVIPGARKEIMPEEIALIEDYLGKGGRVLVCVDPEYDTSLNEWVLNWGIRVGDDIVVDNSAAGVRQGAGPTEPLLYSYDREHPITQHLMKAFTTMPTVRSVRLGDTPPEELELTVLASTSDNSWGERNRGSLAVKNPTFDPDDLSGPVPVAVAMLKKLKERKPGFEEVYTGPGGEMPSQEKLQEMRLEKSTVRAQLVVFGDSQFASNTYLRYGGNWDLFMNTVNWLIGDERLVTIRPKDPEDQTVYITQRQSKRMALVVQIIVPVVVFLFGGWVMIMRRLR